VFAVVRIGNNLGYAVCAFGNGSANGFGCNFESLGSAPRYVWTQNIVGGNDAYYSDGLVNRTGEAHILRWSLSSGSLSFGFDGSDVGSLSYDGSFVPDATSTGFVVGGLYPIPTINRGWLGSIAELIVWNRKLSPSEATQVHGYLSAKYAI
jgi:hypothetical protein